MTLSDLQSSFQPVKGQYADKQVHGHRAAATCGFSR